VEVIYSGYARRTLSRETCNQALEWRDCRLLARLSPPLCAMAQFPVPLYPTVLLRSWGEGDPV